MKKIRLDLRIGCRDRKVAHCLESVLKPDNKSIPKDQRFSIASSSDLLTVTVESQRIGSAFSSIESILADVKLFQEVWLL